jgi:hypothetical protein
MFIAMPARMRQYCQYYFLMSSTSRPKSSFMSTPPTPARATRLRLQHFLQVHDTSNQQLLGRLVDLSLTGMMLISTQALPPEQEYSVEIRTTPDHPVPSLRLQAVSVWCRNNPNNLSHFGIGFRFSGVTTEMRTHLERLMQQPGVAH